MFLAGYYFDWYYFVLVLPAILLALVMQIKVKSTFSRYSGVLGRRGYTGAQVVEKMLRDNGITDVRIEQVAGELTDHYDPRAKVIRLSSSVYSGTSVAAVGVAAHEAGHAVQYSRKYAPIGFRNAVLPAAQIGSTLSPFIIIMGLFMSLPILIIGGIILFAAVVLFQLVTLPVEFNASARAIRSLNDGFVLDDDELRGAKKVLTAAALTYIASLIVSVMSLLRFILLANNRRDRR